MSADSSATNGVSNEDSAKAKISKLLVMMENMQANQLSQNVLFSKLYNLVLDLSAKVDFVNLSAKQPAQTVKKTRKQTTDTKKPDAEQPQDVLIIDDNQNAASISAPTDAPSVNISVVTNDDIKETIAKIKKWPSLTSGEQVSQKLNKIVFFKKMYELDPTVFDRFLTPQVKADIEHKFANELTGTTPSERESILRHHYYLYLHKSEHGTAMLRDMKDAYNDMQNAQNKKLALKETSIEPVVDELSIENELEQFEKDETYTGNGAEESDEIVIV
jgi:hypothetical protein